MSDLARAVSCWALVLAVFGACRAPAPAPAPAPDPDLPRVGSPARLVRARLLMGTEIEISVEGLPRERLVDATERAFAEFERLEGIFTDWRAGSAISDLNERAGGVPLAVPREVIEVLEQAHEVSVETSGAFDVTYRTVGRHWSFEAGKERVPDPSEIAASLPHVGFEKVRVDRDAGTVGLADRDTQIGLGGVAKGYAVDRAVAILEGQGVPAGEVNAGGDLGVFRRTDSGAAPARVGIRHPDRPDELLAVIAVCNASVHTSGDYERFFERDGVRYHHILDPRTGWPARGTRAVTVVARRDGTRADALSTGLFVMGADRAVAWADRHPELAVLAMAPDGGVRSTSTWRTLVGGDPIVDREDEASTLAGCGDR